MNNWILSADIGGSHITAALIDLDDKVILPNTLIRRPVNCLGTAEEILNSWTLTLKEVRAKIGISVDRLALAMPGPFDYQLGISRITGLHKYESLFGLNIKVNLANTLRIRPEDLTIVNDAEAFLLGEVAAGIAFGAKSEIGFTLGTGMGSAVFKSGFTRDANWGSKKLWAKHCRRLFFDPLVS